MSSFNSNKKKILDLLDCQIDDSLLYSILFEMNRYFDKDLTNTFQEVQKKYNRVFNQKERNILRKYFYYKQQSALKLVEINEFPSITYNNKDVEYIINECISRCETYGNEKIINSIKERKNNVENEDVLGVHLMLMYGKEASNRKQ